MPDLNWRLCWVDLYGPSFALHLLVFCFGQRNICNKIVPFVAHPATVEHGGFLVTVPRILDLVTRHWSNVSPVFYSEGIWVRISTQKFVLFSCFRGTFFMKGFVCTSCNFSFTNATCWHYITLQSRQVKGLIGHLNCSPCCH